MNERVVYLAYWQAFVLVPPVSCKVLAGVDLDSWACWFAPLSATYGSQRKRLALDCHASQFQPGPNAVGTRLNSPLFRQLVESRDAQFGAQAGVTWAEGIVVREPVSRPTLFKEVSST